MVRLSGRRLMSLSVSLSGPLPTPSCLPFYCSKASLPGFYIFSCIFLFTFTNIGNPKAVDREIAVAGLHKKKKGAKKIGDMNGQTANKDEHVERMIQDEHLERRREPSASRERMSMTTG